MDKILASLVLEKLPQAELKKRITQVGRGDRSLARS
jgi:hypothetical protein